MKVVLLRLMGNGGLNIMKLRFRKFTKDDCNAWEIKAKGLFSVEDFCDTNYLLNPKNKIQGWCLLDDNDEWIGCCFVDARCHDYNTSGIHFLEICTFPKYHGKGYGKYLLKIMFDNSLSKTKSVCIAPDNYDSIRLFEKYGFKKSGKHKCWYVYLCDKDYYPSVFKDLQLTEIFSENESQKDGLGK